MHLLRPFEGWPCWIAIKPFFLRSTFSISVVIGFIYFLFWVLLCNVLFFSLDFWCFSIKSFYLVFSLFDLDLESDVGGDGESGDLGFSKWLESIRGKPGFWVWLFLYVYVIMFARIGESNVYGKH